MSETPDSDHAAPDDAGATAAIAEAAGTAAASGDVGALSALSDAHGDAIHMHRADGWTALHLAAFYGHADAVRLLLDRGAPPAALSRNSTGNTALHAAIAGSMDGAVIAALLEGGSDVNAIGANDITPLHLAAARGDRGVADLLMARGADPRARMEDGSMPFHLAEARGHGSLAMWLEGHAAP